MNKLSSIIGAAAVIAIAFVFIIQFRPASNAARVDSGPTCVAEIHGTCISANNFWAAYRLLTYRGGDAARLKAMGLRRQTAEGLVEQWVLNQDAKRLGIVVSDDDGTGFVHVAPGHGEDDQRVGESNGVYALETKDVDFAPLITKLKTENPDIIYFGGVMPQIRASAPMICVARPYTKILLSSAQVPAGMKMPSLVLSARNSVSAVSIDFVAETCT